jgi:predicted RNA-binding Zn ribbon-like protein
MIHYRCYNLVGVKKMKPVDTVHASDWKDGFLVVGNHLALDFLNTRPIQNNEPTELLPDFRALLRWFQAAELISIRAAASLQQEWGKSARGRRTVKAMRELREKLRKEILAWEGGSVVHNSTVDELNRLMADYPMRTRLRTKGFGTELWFEPRQPEDLFAPLAHSSATLFADVDRSRVRKCAHCVLHFLDTSKKGTRRWCSMQLCGNRLKVAAYAARQRMQSHK